MIAKTWNETISIVPIAGANPFSKMTGGVLSYGAFGAYVNSVYLAALGILAVGVTRYRGSVPSHIQKLLQEITCAIPDGAEQMDKEQKALLLLRSFLTLTYVETPGN
jgi:hypothetical protein